MRNIVHISGYTLAAMQGVPAMSPNTDTLLPPSTNDWEEVCWGRDTLLGRIPMGLWLARKVRANRIVWSTGASRRQHDGKIESEVLYEMALQNYHNLRRQFPHRFSKSEWTSEGAYTRWLKDTRVFESNSKNTSQSMTALRALVTDYVRPDEQVMIYLVSSANHAPRVLRDAQVAFAVGSKRSDTRYRVALAAVSAETNYAGKHTEDVIVRDLGT